MERPFLIGILEWRYGNDSRSAFGSVRFIRNIRSSTVIMIRRFWTISVRQRSPWLLMGKHLSFQHWGQETLYNSRHDGDSDYFPTQNGDASCTCSFPMLVRQWQLWTQIVSSGTVSTIWWGGAGTSQTGGTALYRAERALPTADSSLTIFEGQGPLGHYAQQGSYNLMHVVEFLGGCTYSAYYDELGAALIDFVKCCAVSVLPIGIPTLLWVTSAGDYVYH